MYSRSYNDRSDGVMIPDGYSGTALPLGVHTEEAEEEISTSVDVHDDESESAGLFSGLLSRLPLGGLSDILPKNLGIKRFGTEEILILAVAAFLLFSHDGDLECALMLLLLLFIN